MSPNQRSSFVFATSNTFLTIPIIKEFVKELKMDYDIYVSQIKISSYEEFFNEYVGYNCIAEFEDYGAYNSQGIIMKIQRYMLTVSFILGFIFRKSENKVYIYSIDVFTIWLCLLFKRTNIFVIYHQFEVLEAEKLNLLDSFCLKSIKKMNNKLDAIIFPEENRAKYYFDKDNIGDIENILIIPNSNNNDSFFHPRKEDYLKKNIIHVGSLGADQYIHNYLEAISMIKDMAVEFSFIGHLKEDVVRSIEAKKDSRIKIIRQVPHNELKHIYENADAGVILYKDVSLNHRYCAPNKLYEYWSYGIPVLGDNLPGLKTVFKHPFLGKLVDMEDIDELATCISELISWPNKDREKICFYFRDKQMLKHYFHQLLAKLN